MKDQTERKPILKVCENCFMLFETRAGNAKLCLACRIDPEIQKQRARARKYKSTKLNKIIAELEAYNKENNTNLSYGQYIALVKGRAKK